VAIHPFQIYDKDLNIHGCWSYPQIQFKEALGFLKLTMALVAAVITVGCHSMRPRWDCGCWGPRAY
jgi:hypothetical protein